MRLKNAHLIRFKRFKNLKIIELPPEAKLIVLLGPNGCGKSSLFDSFQRFLKVDKFYGMGEDLRRYYQQSTIEADTTNHNVDLKFHDKVTFTTHDFKKSLYTRTSYRHDPSFNNPSIEQPGEILDKHYVIRQIDTDKTVQENYKRIIWQLVSKVTTPGLTTDQIMMDTIGKLQESMHNVFGDLSLDNLVSPGETGTFTFSKGKSKHFLYESLSAGEKAAFDLLLDIIVKKKSFNDSLYCIDEPEIHLNTRIQGKLLKEVYDLVPECSQLWLATHSIGMVRAAQEIHANNPQYVVFLDLGFNPDGRPRNYDEPQIIKPSNLSRNFWSQHYSVALDDLATLLAPSQIVFCEGSTENSDLALDEACYNRIFAQEFPETQFISVGSVTNVENRMNDLLPILKKIGTSTKLLRFRDRDSLTPEEIEEKKNNGIRVMSSRNLETLLLSDEVLMKLCHVNNKLNKYEIIKNARDNVRAEGHASDDFKPAVQSVHHVVRKELDLPQPGETKNAFMRDILAPLVTEGTQVYNNLKSDIFGSIS